MPPEILLNQQDTAAEIRNKRLRYAIVSSFGSKITTAVLQLVALPIAVNALGKEQFILYAMLSSAVGWISMANIGIGPALIVNIASAAARGARETEERLFTSALMPILLIVMLLGTGLFILINFIAVGNIFGANYVVYTDTIKRGLFLLSALVLLQSILSVIEAAQSGYQEQYIVNLTGMIGNFISIGAIIIVAKYGPSVVGMILAVNASPFIVRTINAAYFFIKRSFLLPKKNKFSWDDCKHLLGNGFSFSLAGGLGNFLCHVFPIILVGRTLSAQSSAAFVVSMNALIIASGVIIMLTTPLWPAFADSLVHNDVRWAQRTYHRMLLYGMAYAGLVGLVLALLGRDIFLLWFGGSIHANLKLTFSLGLYFILLSWENIHFTILIGAKDIWRPSILYLVRSLLSVGVMSVMIRNVGESGPFWALCGSTILVTIIPFTYLVRRYLSDKVAYGAAN